MGSEKIDIGNFGTKDFVGTNLFWFINEYQNDPGDQSAFSGGSMDSRFCPVKSMGFTAGMMD